MYIRQLSYFRAPTLWSTVATCHLFSRENGQNTKIEVRHFRTIRAEGYKARKTLILRELHNNK